MDSLSFLSQYYNPSINSIPECDFSFPDENPKFAVFDYDNIDDNALECANYMFNNDYPILQPAVPALPALPAPKKTMKRTRANQSGQWLAITREHLIPYFNVPYEHAAKKMGIGRITFRKICTRLCLRWPYRALQNVDQFLKNTRFITAKDVATITTQRDAFIKGDITNISRVLSALRQKCYQTRHAKRPKRR